MRWKLMVGVGAVVLFGAACACNASDTDNDDLTILWFDVPSSADCSDGELGMVHVSWDTTKATEFALSVDGEEVMSGFDPSGGYTADVICDGEDHDIELTASDDDNPVSETETVSTEADGGDSGGGSGGGTGTTTTTSGSGTTTTTSSTTTSTTTTTTLAPTPSDSPAPTDGGNLPFNTRQPDEAE